MVHEPDRPYQQLQHRAVDFIQESGGSVLEDHLIRQVFGANGSPELWRSLLRRILGDDDRITLRADGAWCLTVDTSPAVNGLMPDSFVVLDVETTGLQPSRQRMIEFGAIRYSDGKEQSRISLLINPDRQVPAFITRLTGIDSQSLAGAPRFQEVAESISEFIGQDLVVGFNVGFDIAFIDMELKRIGVPSLLNPRLDLLPLSSALLPNVRSRGLESLARALGLKKREHHRALSDVETTADLLFHLLQVAERNGIGEFDSLKRVADRPTNARPNRNEPVGRGRAVLDISHIADVRPVPGVYLMFDRLGRIIYVGKAKNLRNRVRSYYSEPLGYTRKMDGLLQSIDKIETVETGSELTALLLESQFIARYRPQFNRQQRNSDSYPFIKLDLGNPWPRLTVAKRREPDGADYFGPFRSSSTVRDTVDLLNDIFPLRTCTRSFRNSRSYGSACLELELNRCPGPCVGKANRDSYRETVRTVQRFLRGEDQGVFDWLHQQLADSAEQLDFERASKLRRQIERVQRLVENQQQLDQMAQHGDYLILNRSPETGTRELLMIVRGRLWAQLQWRNTDTLIELAERLTASWSRALQASQDHQLQLDSADLDSAQIIGRWIRKHADNPAILPIESGGYGWQAMLLTFENIDDEALEFHTNRGGEEVASIEEVAPPGLQ